MFFGCFSFFRKFFKILTVPIVICFILFNYSYLNDVFWTNSCNTPPIKQRISFYQNWCRMSKARLDWRSILAPCTGNTRLGVTKEEWGQENATDPVKSYISLWDIRPVGQFSKFSIQTQTSDGRLKKFGGDAWRIHLTGPSSIAPTVFDLSNGTYEVLFLAMEPGVYKAEIMLDYTLCDGLRDPPDDWFKIGTVQGKMQRHPKLANNFDYLLLPLWKSPPTLIIIPPPDKSGPDFRPLLVENKRMEKTNCSVKCQFIWNGFGRWVNGKWHPFIKGMVKRTRAKALNKGTLWIYGDSLGVYFTDSIKRRSLCRSIFNHCNNTYNWVYPLSKNWRNNIAFDGLDFDYKIIIDNVKFLLSRPELDSTDSAVVLNFGLHFVESTNFSNYRNLIDGLVELFKERASVSKGREIKTHIVWKTTTAINKQRSVLPHRQYKRFLTYQRVLLYNAYATSAMCAAGINVLDVYPLTDSYPKGTGYHGDRFTANDVVHYNDSVFWPVENLLENYFGT